MEKGENMNDALEKVSGDVVTEVSKLENKRRKQNKYSKDSYARQCGRFGPAFLQHRADIVNKSRNKARHVRTLNHDEAKQWQLEIHAGKIEMYVDVKIEKDRAILNDLLQSSLMEKSPTESSVLPSGRPLREAAAKTLLPSFHGYETNLDDLLYVKWTKEFGWGVYAAKRIEGSTKLTFYNGVAMNKEEMLAQETNDKIFQPDPDVEWYINGDINDMEQFDHNEVITGDEIKRIPNIAALMNHACVCESTAIVVIAKAKVIGKNGKTVATNKIQIEIGVRDVEAHEQITFDYGLRDDDDDDSNTVFSFLKNSKCVCEPF